MKYNGLSRRVTMDIAKIIRDSPMAPTSRLNLVRRLADYFQQDNPLWSRKTFIDIISQRIPNDARTEWATKLGVTDETV